MDSLLCRALFFTTMTTFAFRRLGSAIGRRSAVAFALAGAGQRDLGAFLQAVAALGDDLLAHLQAAGDLHFVDRGLAARDRTHGDRLVFLQHVDEIAGGAVAYR